MKKYDELSMKQVVMYLLIGVLFWVAKAGAQAPAPANKTIQIHLEYRNRAANPGPNEQQTFFGCMAIKAPIDATKPGGCSTDAGAKKILGVAQCYWIPANGTDIELITIDGAGNRTTIAILVGLQVDTVSVGLSGNLGVPDAASHMAGDLWECEDVHAQ